MGTGPPLGGCPGRASSLLAPGRVPTPATQCRDSGPPERRVVWARRRGGVGRGQTGRGLQASPAGGHLGAATGDGRHAGQLPGACPRAQGVPGRIADGFLRWRRLWNDGGCSGDTFGRWVRAHWPQLKVQVIKRSDQGRGIAVLPCRRGVERSLRWRMGRRRWVHNPERTQSGADAWIHRGQASPSVAPLSGCRNTQQGAFGHALSPANETGPATGKLEGRTAGFRPRRGQQHAASTTKRRKGNLAGASPGQ